jgi:hypothetical protein
LHSVHDGQIVCPDNSEKTCHLPWGSGKLHRDKKELPDNEFQWKNKDLKNSYLLSFNQITNDFVVEILDWSPINLFSCIFFLLCLQCVLDENLLKFLVYIVDTEIQLIKTHDEKQNIPKLFK